MQTTLETTWVVRLSPEEARTLSRALRGEIKSEEERAVARKLADAFTYDRKASAQTLANQMAHHVDVMENSRNNV